MADEKNSPTPAYYAVIPAKVRYDSELCPNAKILYAEITALANSGGYCFASNEYLAGLYKFTKRTVSTLIAQLAERGYVTVEILRDTTGEVLERRIYVDVPGSLGTPHEKIFHTPGKDIPDPHEKIFQENITSNNTIPPIVPQKGTRSRRVKSAPDHKPERFEAFWKFYPRKESRIDAVRAWDKLKPSDELIAQMGLALKWQMAREEWQRGVGIPYAATWLNKRRWEDVETKVIPERNTADDGWDGSVVEY